MPAVLLTRPNIVHATDISNHFNGVSQSVIKSLQSLSYVCIPYEIEWGGWANTNIPAAKSPAAD
jgi:hypothetical protein